LLIRSPPWLLATSAGVDGATSLTSDEALDIRRTDRRRARPNAEARECGGHPFARDISPLGRTRCDRTPGHGGDRARPASRRITQP
jgi:hypothetical protein